MSFDSLEKGLAAFWPKIKKALDTAIDRLVSDREKEGSALALDLTKRTKKIEAMLAAIKSRAHLNIDEYRKRFAERVKDFFYFNDFYIVCFIIIGVLMYLIFRT